MPHNARLALHLYQSCIYETAPCHELFLTHKDMKPGSQRPMYAFSVGRTWKMSNFQMSGLSRKVSAEQRPVIPTVLDRSSDICVQEQAHLCSALFWRGLWGYHEEEQTPSDLIPVTTVHRHNESLLKMWFLVLLQGNVPPPSPTAVILNDEVHLWIGGHVRLWLFHLATKLEKPISCLENLVVRFTLLCLYNATEQMV